MIPNSNEARNNTASEQKTNNNNNRITNTFFDILLILSGAGLIIAFDQWTKKLVVENIPFLGTWLPDSLSSLAPFFRIVHWRNSGAAFGIFQNGNLAFIILAIFASMLIIFYFPQIERKEWALRTAMVLQLGGAVGNLIDRIRYGYVIDFISVGDFPVFNIADSSITVGVVVLVIGVIIQELNEKKLIQQNKQRTDERVDLEESQP